MPPHSVVKIMHGVVQHVFIDKDQVRIFTLAPGGGTAISLIGPMRTLAEVSYSLD